MANELHYGFFGLTSLGTTSAFKFGLMSMMDMSEFSDEEWIEAFDKFDIDKSGVLDVSEINALLRHIYHGPPPDGQAELFMAKFDANSDGSITREEFAAGIAEMKQEQKANIEEKGNPGAVYNSVTEFQERLRANKLLKESPAVCYHSPMTTSQTLGWVKPDMKKLKEGIKPKLSCAETEVR